VGNSVTEWRYDEGTASYTRWIDTANMPELAPHVDILNGKVLGASTVVVLFAPYVPANIREEEGGQVHFSYDIQLVGSGPAYIFRDGQRYTATWEREDEVSGLPRFVDATGKAIAFRPGPIWFDVLDPDSPTRFEAGVFYTRAKVPPPGPAATATLP
jgi:hypothetical protein